MINSNSHYAHSVNGKDKKYWQTLSDHLKSVSSKARLYADAFGAGELAATAGLLHDLGKYSKNFQERLQGSKNKVDHSTYGAKLAWENKKWNNIGKILAYTIAGHHTGLPNGRLSGKINTLYNRRNIDLPKINSTIWESEISLPNELSLPSSFKPAQSYGQFQISFLIRMLYSCLVDADFLDTEEFYSIFDKKNKATRGNDINLDKLRRKLEDYLLNFKPTNQINQIRAKILSNVRNHAHDKPGVFSLTAPTGSGKTLASLAFALDHSIQWKMQHIIFVIPFTNIIEQTVKVFRKALKTNDNSIILEHHSAFNNDSNSSENLEAEEKRQLAVENWDASIIVTTAVQFFESLYSNHPSNCRKLHNIANSTIVLDEPQTMPLSLLRPCIATLNELARNYRSSIVLCTATQPALNHNIFIDDKLCSPKKELVHERKKLFDLLDNRFTVKHIGETSDKRLVEKIFQSNQVLCIVNNREHARFLYDDLVTRKGTAFLLTTLICAKNRSQILTDVKKILSEGGTCRLIATSLVEAGVDIDFPIVFREETGLDSIAQAAGRCNREGKRNKNDSQVVIFTNKNWEPPIEIKQFAQTANEILRKHKTQPLSQAAIKDYFDVLYTKKGATELDAENLLNIIEKGRLDDMPFEKLAELFKMICTQQKPVIIPCDKQAIDLIESLKYIKKNNVWRFARKLQPYIVQLPNKQFFKLSESGVIEPIRQDLYGKRFIQLINKNLYDPKAGFSLAGNPVYINPSNLVV